MNSPANIAGYFGKLPGFSDFIKYNAGGEEILVFDKWLQDGLASAKLKMKSDLSKYYKSSDNLFFFFPFTGTERILSGLLIFSSDKSNREFPFIIFFTLQKDQFNSSFYLIPMLLSDILNNIDITFNDISTINNISILNERLNEISFNLISSSKDNIYQNYLNNTLQSEFWERILERSDENTKLSILNNLFPKHNTEQIKVSFLSPGDQYLNDLSFLLQLTISNLKTINEIPAIFWTNSENKNHLLYIYKNKPTANNFIDLIKQNTESEEQSTDFDNRFHNLLNKEKTLKEFLSLIQ